MGVWQNSCPQLNANVCRGKLCVLPLSLPVKHYNVESPWARFITVCSAVTYQVLLQLVNPRAMHRLCRYIVLSARPDEYASFSLLDFYARVLPHTRSDTHARTRANVHEVPLGNNTHPHIYNAVWIPVHVRTQQSASLEIHSTHVVICIVVIP